jgi:hypothetical protein
MIFHNGVSSASQIGELVSFAKEILSTAEGAEHPRRTQ